MIAKTSSGPVGGGNADTSATANSGPVETDAEAGRKLLGTTANAVPGPLAHVATVEAGPAEGA